MIRVIACINADGNLAGFTPPKTDLQRFAALTIGGTVIMGRKTWEALPPERQPLPNRRNIIVTRQPNYQHPSDVAGYAGPCGLSQAVVDGLCRGGAWVIGGGEIYAQAMAMEETSLVYLSQTIDVGGSVPFPIAALSSFERIVRQGHADHIFEIWKRVKA